MSLIDIPVITPDNIKLILQQAFSDYSAKLNTKMKVSLNELKNSLVLTADTTIVDIGIACNKDTDIIHVFKDNILVETGYTITNTAITFDAAIVATAEAPVTIKFNVIKATLSTI